MPQDYFFYKTDGLLQRINYDDILFLETADNYTKMHTAKGFHIVRMTFKSALQHLKNRRYVQIHRSFAISVDKIEVIAREFIVPVSEPEVHIPFHRNYWPQLLEQIKILGPQSEPGDEADTKNEKDE